MALNKTIVLPDGVSIEYIKIRDCQVIVDIYKDAATRNDGKQPVESKRLSINDLVGDDMEQVSVLAEAIASDLYAQLKLKHFPDAEDC